MRSTGPRQPTSRPFAVVVLVAALLLVASPASILLHPGGTAPPAGGAEASQVAPEPCPSACYVPGGLTLASIFPLGSDREHPNRSDPEPVGLTDERAGDLFDVLGSETARTLLQRLAEEPLTASELAEGVDTSLQNVHYHLENLHEAEAITELDVEYSARGREMSVYTATCRPQVLLYDIDAPESD